MSTLIELEQENQGLRDRIQMLEEVEQAGLTEILQQRETIERLARENELLVAEVEDFRDELIRAEREANDMIRELETDRQRHGW